MGSDWEGTPIDVKVPTSSHNWGTLDSPLVVMDWLRHPIHTAKRLLYSRRMRRLMRKYGYSREAFRMASP